MNTQNKNKNKTVKRRNVTNKTVKNNSNTEVQTLRNTYGYITIPKGMSFYHARDTPYDTANPDFMLFLTFDIDDWNNSEDKYVTKFVVKKDFDVLFMVNSIDTTYGGKLFSLLHVLLNNSIEHNLNKQYEPNLHCYFPYIVKENLAGWFCSVENRTGIEIAIYNSNEYLKAIETVKVIDDLTQYKSKKTNRINKTYTNIYKLFGYNISLNNKENSINSSKYTIVKYTNIRKKYTLTSDKYPVTLHINEKYEEDMSKLQNKSKNKSKENKNSYALQKIFQNANIKYFKNKYSTNMFWNC
jgi:hypothetical protein